MADQLLTQKELAEHIGCHRNTIPRMEKRGDIPAQKISSTRRRQWLREEIEPGSHYLAQLRTMN